MRIYGVDVGHMMNIGQRYSIAFYSFISSNSFISKASITFKRHDDDDEDDDDDIEQQRQ